MAPVTTLQRTTTPEYMDYRPTLADLREAQRDFENAKQDALKAPGLDQRVADAAHNLAVIQGGLDADPV